MLNKTFSPIHTHLKIFFSELEHFLSVAIAITNHVITAHKKNTIIQFLNTQTICWDTQFPIKKDNITLKTNTDAELLKNYQSPEQRGEINIDIDYRSDLYSLGIIFHEMITLSLPTYSQESGIELDFSSNQTIPKTITLIIQKLLFTCPDHRYQTATGLLLDLQNCQSQLSKSGAINIFFPGKHDKRHTLVFGNVLYGRDAEQSSLIKTYDKVKLGDSKCVFIQGYSGIGKTTLVKKTLFYKAKSEGFFISGKYDPVHNNPHEAIVQAFADLVTQLVANTKDKDLWKKRLSKALYPNADLISHFIPNLAQLMGVQTSLASSAIEQEKNRIFQCITDFITCITAHEKKPLLIFLDDIHRANTESLSLIKHIMDTPPPYVLLIGAFRNNECPADHPLHTWVTQQKTQHDNTIIKLDNLSEHDTQKTLYNTLHHNPKRYQNTIILDGISEKQLQNQISDIFQLDSTQPELIPLTKLIYEKTHGNPFFIRQLLQYMKHTKIITFNTKFQTWEWSIDTLKTITVSDNVADITSTSIHNLPKQTQTLLTKAACLGVTFTINDLAIIAKTNTTNLRLYLWHAETNNLIIKYPHHKISCDDNNADNDRYKFLHDKIQEAAYNLIPTDKRAIYHWDIGLSLHNATQSSPIADTYILTIASHLNKGLSCINTNNDNQLLCQINLLAAQKSKKNLAYQAMYTYLHNGIQRLPSNHQKKPTPETFNYYILYLKATYLCKESKQISPLFNTIKSIAFSPIQHAEFYKIYTEQAANLGKLDQAIDIGLEGITLLKIAIPKTPSSSYLLRHSLLLKWQLSLFNIKNIQKKDNEITRIIIPLLISVAAAAHQKGNPNLLFGLIFKIMALSLQYGHSNASLIAYTSYAFFLSSMDNYKQSYNLSRVAESLLKENTNIEFKIITIHICESFIKPWYHPFQTSHKNLQENYKLAIRASELYFLGFSFLNAIVLERNFKLYSKDIPQSITFIPTIKEYCNFFDHYHDVMSGKTQKNQSIFFKPKTMPNSEDIMLKSYYLELQQTVLFLFCHYTEAFNLFLNHTKVLKTYNLPPSKSNICLYTFLAGIKTLNKHPLIKKIYYIWILYRSLKQMKRWSKLCKTNFYHRYLVMKAEWKRMLNQKKASISLYKQAISEAEKSGFLLDQAMIHEWFAQIYTSENNPNQSQLHQTQAIHYYTTYKAYAKAEQLKTTISS